MKISHLILAAVLTAAGSASAGRAVVIGTPAADLQAYEPVNRRHEGIPSIAVDPKTDRRWAVWYGGVSNSEDSNNYLVLATSADGNVWREVLIYDPDGEGPWRAFDSEIWVSPDGKLRWFWTERKVKLRGSLGGKDTPEKLGVYAGHTDPEAMATDRLMMLTLAADREPTDFSLVPRQIGKGVMMCKPIVSSRGEWVLPVSEWFKEESAKLLFSADGGATFTVSSAGASMPEKIRTFDEHSVVEMNDGSFRIWARTNGGCQSAVTRDRGATWSPVEPATFGLPATRTTLRRLKSGAILLVKHGTDIASRAGGRSCLTAFVSDDEGATWQGGLVLDPRKGGSYCDVDQGPDGTIHAIWDYSRTKDRDILCARFTEGDVRKGWGLSRGFVTQELVSTGRQPTVPQVRTVDLSRDKSKAQKFQELW